MTQDEAMIDELPDALAQVAGECGLGVAMTLAGTFGGRELYFPSPDAIGETHPLALALGLATARIVSGLLGPGKVLIPMGPASTRTRRKAAIARMKKERKSNAVIAAALGIHVRTVEYHVSKERDRDDERQPGFFDD